MVKDNKTPPGHHLRSPDSREKLTAFLGLTQSSGYAYLKQLAEAVADKHAGDLLPQNAEDRERLYEAGLIRKGFQKLFATIEAIVPAPESTLPSDLLERITIEQTPPEMTKENK